MATEIDVVNAALIKLGETPINALTDQRKSARIALTTFAEHRDFVLQDHTWNHATRWVELPASANAPPFGALRAFPLSQEHLRVVSVVGEEYEPWEVQSFDTGRAIVTDLEPPLQATIIFRVENVGLGSPQFRDALSQYCASQWALPLTGDRALVDQMLSQYVLKVATARSSDGREGTQPKSHIHNSWLDER